MADNHSFDIVCKIDEQEIVNAVQQTQKETAQRYDFKNAKVFLEFDSKNKVITLKAESDFRLKSLAEILEIRMAKRNLPLGAINRGAIETTANGTASQEYKIQDGIPIEKAKEIVKLIKSLKIKAQAAIQGDQVRITSKSIDNLQLVQEKIRAAELKIHVEFVNYH